MTRTIATMVTGVVSLVTISGGSAIGQTPTPTETPTPTPISAPPASSLSERPNYIGTCRSSGAVQLKVYADTAQTQPLGEIPAYTKIILTGILAPGLAQLRSPIVGWAPAGGLLTNCDATPPQPGTLKGECRQLESFPDLRNGLTAYDTPGGAMQTYQGKTDGPAANAKVYFTKPVSQSTHQGRPYVRVFYLSLSGSERLGWVSAGVVINGQLKSNFKLCQ